MALDITTSINLDMKAPNTVTVYGNQYDSAGRVKAYLLNNGEKWTVPNGAKPVVMFKKSDNIGGFYDITEAGTTAVTIDADRSIIYINLDVQTLTTAGRVQMQVNFYQSNQRLSTFAFYLQVKASAVKSSDVTSSWVFNILSQEISQTLTVATTPQAMTNWLNENITQETGYVIDNTLTVAGAASDAKATGRMVTISDTNPNIVANKVWVKKTPSTLEIPTMEDMAELKNCLNTGNLNQQVKVNPFVIGTKSTDYGCLLKNRANLNILESGAVRATLTSSDAITYGFWVGVPNNSMTGRKFYVSFHGFSSQSASHREWRFLVSQVGITIPSTRLTLSDDDTDWEFILDITPIEETASFQFNFLDALTERQETPSEHSFTLETMQIIDLTTMFGAGYEPTVEEFKAIYGNGMPYEYYYSNVVPDSRVAETFYAINRNSLENKAPAIINTADGDTVIIYDGADGMPIKSLVANIEPMQAGSGDPSPGNMRLINGWTGLNGGRCRSNLVKNVRAGSTYTGDSSYDAEIFSNGSFTLTHKENEKTLVSVLTIIPLTNYTSLMDEQLREQPTLFVLKEGQTYYIQDCVLGGFRKDTGARISINDSSLPIDGHSSNVYTPTTDIYIKQIRAFISSTEAYDGTFVYEPMVTIEPVESFEPYTGTDISVNWKSEAGTVYNGTIDVISGKLKSIHALVELDGVTTGKKFTYTSTVTETNMYGLASPTDGDKGGYISKYIPILKGTGMGLICNIGKYVGDSIATYSSIVGYTVYASSEGTQYVSLRMSFPLEMGLNTIEKANAYAAEMYNNGTPIQMLYKLKDPIEYQLTPQQITTLLGENRIWADVGPISIEYSADTEMNISRRSIRVVNSFDELAKTTEDYVLVLNNDSKYNKRGSLLYQKMAATERGYERDDGSLVYPAPDQGTLVSSKPPVDSIMPIIRSYVDNDQLVYAQINTVLQDDAINNIDCSTFISAVLQGIPYSATKYVCGENKIRCRVTHESFASDDSAPVRMRTDSLAEYFAENKRLFQLNPTNVVADFRKLQFGDILFFCNREYRPNRYYNIAHTAFVLYATDDGANVMVAHVTSGIDPGNGKKFGFYTGQIERFSQSALTSQGMILFARPNYNELLGNNTNYSIAKKLLLGTYQFDIRNRYIPGLWINANNNYNVEPSNVNGICVEYYDAIPGATITYTGATKDSGNNNYYCAVVEYTEDYTPIAKTAILSTPMVLSSNARYIRFQFGYAASAVEKPLTLHTADDFAATMTL